MRLSKTGYYADFAVYAGLVTTAAIVSGRHNTGYEMSRWLLAVIVGSMLWTLAEYVLHRFVLHRIAPFASMHDAHQPRGATPGITTHVMAAISALLPRSGITCSAQP
jgi:hypothetical protein